MHAHSCMCTCTHTHNIYHADIHIDMQYNIIHSLSRLKHSSYNQGFPLALHLSFIILQYVNVVQHYNQSVHTYLRFTASVSQCVTLIL